MRRWALFRRCGECNEPTRIVEVCEELGYNPGVDGHLFRSEKEAYRVLELLIENSRKNQFYDDVDVLEVDITLPEHEEEAIKWHRRYDFNEA